MTLLLDTNIIVDVLTKRNGYSDSLQILRFCEINKAEGHISAVTITDLMYILRKYIEPKGVRQAVQALLTILDVAAVGKSEINGAFQSEMTDFEDAVQAQCAKRLKADYIVTRNLRDFKASHVPAISPADAVTMLRST